MDAMNVCILLVDGNLASAARASLLLESKYEDVAPSVIAHRTNAPGGILYKEGGESCLRRYLDNPHSREQLKRIIQVSWDKWEAFLTPMAPVVSPPPPTTVLPDTSGVPPISIPVALAREIEKFIHITEAGLHAPPGFLYIAASRMAMTGPSVLEGLPEAGEELEPSFLEELDTDDVFDAIEELFG